MGYVVPSQLKRKEGGGHQGRRAQSGLSLLSLPRHDAGESPGKKPSPHPLPHTQGPLDKDLTEWEGPAGRPSGSRHRILLRPEPSNLGSQPPKPAGSSQGCLLASTAGSAPKGAANRVPVGGGVEIPFSDRPLPPGSDPRLPRTRPGLSLALPFDPRLVEPRDPRPPPSPALALPRARGQSSGHPDRTVTTL